MRPVPWHAPLAPLPATVMRAARPAPQRECRPDPPAGRPAPLGHALRQSVHCHSYASTPFAACRPPLGSASAAARGCAAPGGASSRGLRWPRAQGRTPGGQHRGASPSLPWETVFRPQALASGTPVARWGAFLGLAAALADVVDACCRAGACDIAVPSNIHRQQGLCLSSGGQVAGRAGVTPGHSRPRARAGGWRFALARGLTPVAAGRARPPRKTRQPARRPCAAGSPPRRQTRQQGKRHSPQPRRARWRA